MTVENSNANQTKALHFACTASLFAIAGPPMGAVSVLLAILASRLPSISPDLTAIPALSVLAMSYVLGFVPAIIAGFLIASRGLWNRVSFRFTLVTASVAIFLPILVYGLVGPLFGSAITINLHLLLLLGLGIGAYPAATICWLIARRAGWLRRHAAMQASVVAS